MVKLKIKEVAKAKGYTLEDIAKQMGITYVGLHGKLKTAKLDTLYEVSKILDCDIRDLIAPTKENNAQPLYIENNGTFDIIGYIDTGKLK